MKEYKRVKIENEGLKVNKRYLKYLQVFKEDEKLKNKLSKREYNFYLKNEERKYMEKDNGELQLVKWDDIISWTAKGRMDRLKIFIKIKNCKNEFDVHFDSKHYLVTVLEKYCFEKGKLSRKTEYKLAQVYLYLIYLIIFILAVLMLKSMLN